jgi:sarcosine oxidase subunit gamma
MAEMSAWSRTGQFIFRGRPAEVAEAGALFGVTLPQEACRAESLGTRAALWLGPDEWLLVADTEEADGLEAAFSAAFQDRPASLVDVSHRNLFLPVSGPLAARILNCGCPLDLDERAFSVGTCTRTILGKAEIILWRRTTDVFWVGAWRSFAAYVEKFLAEARRGLA